MDAFTVTKLKKAILTTAIYFKVSTPVVVEKIKVVI